MIVVLSVLVIALALVALMMSNAYNMDEFVKGAVCVAIVVVVFSILIVMSNAVSYEEPAVELVAPAEVPLVKEAPEKPPEKPTGPNWENLQ